MPSLGEPVLPRAGGREDKAGFSSALVKEFGISYFPSLPRAEESEARLDSFVVS